MAGFQRIVTAEARCPVGSVQLRWQANPEHGGSDGFSAYVWP